MAPVQSIKFQTANFSFVVVVVMGNGKHVLLVLHCLKRGIAFVSSYYYIYYKTDKATMTIKGRL